MEAALLIALFIAGSLGWQIFVRWRRQQQRFSAAVEAAFDEPPRHSSVSVRRKPGRAGRADGARARSRLEEAELASIALSGRLGVALGAQDERAEVLHDELLAADRELANLDSVLREVAGLVGVDHSLPPLEGLSHELPTSLGFGLGRAPATSREAEEALERVQVEAARARLRAALVRAQALEQFREQLADELSRRAS